MSYSLESSSGSDTKSPAFRVPFMAASDPVGPSSGLRLARREHVRFQGAGLGIEVLPFRAWAFDRGRTLHLSYKVLPHAPASHVLFLVGLRNKLTITSVTTIDILILICSNPHVFSQLILLVLSATEVIYIYICHNGCSYHSYQTRSENTRFTDFFSSWVCLRAHLLNG